MYVITMMNRAGELDRREAETEAEIKHELIAMIHECAFLRPGDAFTVEEE